MSFKLQAESRGPGDLDFGQSCLIEPPDSPTLAPAKIRMATARGERKKNTYSSYTAPAPVDKRTVPEEREDCRKKVNQIR